MIILNVAYVHYVLPVTVGRFAMGGIFTKELYADYNFSAITKLST